MNQIEQIMIFIVVIFRNYRMIPHKRKGSKWNVLKRYDFYNILFSYRRFELSCDLSEIAQADKLLL